jgi:hypothetical protein
MEEETNQKEKGNQITVTLCTEQVDAVVLQELRAALEACYIDYWHKGDKAFYKKFKPHMKAVYGYFGGDPNEFE